MTLVRVLDDRKRALDFAAPPRRVVSLVPSDTLNVAALGGAAAATLVGRTDYCELPQDLVARIPSVGGTKNPRIEDIVALEPDLVLANQEENTRRDLEVLAQRGLRVYVAFPRRVADGLAHLAKLARILRVERDPGVRALLARGYQAFRAAEQARASVTPLRTFCPIWMDPIMTIHGDTFISDMLDLCGAANVFADRVRRYPLAADLGRAPALPAEKVAGRDVRYPRVTLDEIAVRAPELVLLPDEPHRFTEQDAEVFRALPLPASVGSSATAPGEAEASRSSAPLGATGAPAMLASAGGSAPRVIFTSGKDLCWYGARTVEAIARVRELIEGAAPRCTRAS